MAHKLYATMDHRFHAAACSCRKNQQRRSTFRTKLKVVSNIPLYRDPKEDNQSIVGTLEAETLLCVIQLYGLWSHIFVLNGEHKNSKGWIRQTDSTLNAGNC